MEELFAFRLEFNVLALYYGLLSSEHHLLYFVGDFLTILHVPVVLLRFPSFF